MTTTPMTMTEKILAHHKMGMLGDDLVLQVDRVFCHEVTTPGAIHALERQGFTAPFDKQKVKAVVDHVVPAKDSATAVQAKELREWAALQGVEFLDVGRHGVCHVVFTERGFVEPGMVVVMGDSHTCTHGSLAAFAFGIGSTDLAVAIARGMVAIAAPQSLRIVLEGSLRNNATAKDIALAVVAAVGTGGANGCVLEFQGDAIPFLSMEERMTIANMAVECGATTGLFPVDNTTIAYLEQTGITDAQRRKEWVRYNADPGAIYRREVRIDVSALQPSIAHDGSPGTVSTVVEFPLQRVDQVWIGSCTNGRISDLRAAANVLRGHSIASHVRAIVTPATTAVWKQAMHEGLFDVFAEAGCCVTGAGCGACIGMSGGVLAPGEVCVSTSNRNFPGRMGPKGTVLLTSPVVAAQAAIDGTIGGFRS